MDKEDQITRKVKVVEKIQESADVTSFYLRPVEGDNPELWDFKAGQHLPVTLDVDDGMVVERTYSLSNGPSRSEYRISVKRESFGQASRFLHDKVLEGDVIEVHKPAGSFILNETSDRNLVLISAGVGLTPMLAMLNQHANSLKKRNAFWIHGARDGDHHPFLDEVVGLIDAHPSTISSHVLYSKPTEDDERLKSYDSVGRIASPLLVEIVPDLQCADFYICGPSAFIADLESELEQLGVGSNRVFSETF